MPRQLHYSLTEEFHLFQSSVIKESIYCMVLSSKETSPSLSLHLKKHFPASSSHSFGVLLLCRTPNQILNLLSSPQLHVSCVCQGFDKNLQCLLTHSTNNFHLIFLPQFHQGLMSWTQSFTKLVRHLGKSRRLILLSQP